MTGFRLAFSLLRIPRLFASLLLFPLFLSVLLVGVQLFVTSLALNAMMQTPKMLQQRMSYSDDNNFVRNLIYGDGKRLPALTVCRWETFEDKEGLPFDLPPQTQECTPDRLDVALHVEDPEHFDVTSYQKIFTGNFERLHVCRTDCKPDVVISIDGDDVRTDTFSVPALVLLNQAYFDEPSKGEYIKVFERQYAIKNLVGTQFMHANGFISAIQLNNLGLEMGLLANIAGIIVIGLWLAIKAHRKVLDYFSRSGALLPMVAAMGKREFYSAIWIVTLFRVGAFLLASIPATFMLFTSIGEADDWGGIFEKDVGHSILWIVALAISFGFAALVASIADLKHRHNLFAFGYRYLPLALAALGGTVWMGTFLLGDGGAGIRDIIVSLPILSIVPIILVPLCQPSLNLLVINTLLTALLTLVLIRSNSRWFAAHLELLGDTKA